MRSLGSMVVFEYPGGEITFHKDLKKYYEIQKHFREECTVLLKYIEESTDPEQNLNILTKELIRFAEKEIIAPLSQYLNLLGLLDFYVRFSVILRTYDVAPHTQDNQPGMGSLWHYL